MKSPVAKFDQYNFFAITALIYIYFFKIACAFLNSYLETIKEFDIVPKEKDELNILLDIFLIDKSIYEVDYELNNRPDWAIIPMQGIRMIMRNFKSLHFD
ncbi:MAG: hypothetical protein Q8933_18795 [Bacteroidota bacterium]|nr:hypothetical protein [Bacteroidota bacterium]